MTKDVILIFGSLFRQAIQELRQEHEDTIQHLKKTKDIEIQAISNTQTHTK